MGKIRLTSTYLCKGFFLLHDHKRAGLPSGYITVSHNHCSLLILPEVSNASPLIL